MTTLKQLRHAIYQCNDCSDCHKHEDIAGGYKNRKILIVSINPRCDKDKTKCKLAGLKANDRMKWSDNLILHKDKAYEKYIRPKAKDKVLFNRPKYENISVHALPDSVYEELWRNKENQFYVKIRKCYGFENVKLHEFIAVIDIVKHASKKEDKKIKDRAKECFKWFIKQLDFMKPSPKLIIFQGKSIFKLLQNDIAICIKDKKKHLIQKEEIDNTLWGKGVVYSCINGNEYKTLFTPHTSGRAMFKWTKPYTEKIKPLIKGFI
jgi:uracil-DNA glycosylase